MDHLCATDRSPSHATNRRPPTRLRSNSTQLILDAKPTPSPLTIASLCVHKTKNASRWIVPCKVVKILLSAVCEIALSNVHGLRQITHLLDIDADRVIESHCKHTAIAAVGDAELQIGTIRARNQIWLPMTVAYKCQCCCVCIGIVGEYLSHDSMSLDETYPITLERELGGACPLLLAQEFAASQPLRYGRRRGVQSTRGFRRSTSPDDDLRRDASYLRTRTCRAHAHRCVQVLDDLLGESFCLKPRSKNALQGKCRSEIFRVSSLSRTVGGRNE